MTFRTRILSLAGSTPIKEVEFANVPHRPSASVIRLYPRLVEKKEERA